jgi:hypothetical protein
VPLSETVDNPHESNTYYSRLTKTAGTFTNLEMMDPELRREWILDTGSQVDVKRLSDGEEMTIPYVEMVLHQDQYGAQSELVSVIERESGDLVKVDKAEVARNPKKYRDETKRGLYHVVNKHKVEDWLTEEELHNAEAGVWSKPITKQHIITEKAAEAAANIPLGLVQGAHLLKVLKKSGPRAFGILGKAGIFFDQLLRYFNEDEAGQSVFNWITGGDEATATEIYLARQQMIAIATKRRKIVLNDTGRLSDKDLSILTNMMSLDTWFASGKQIGESIQEFQGFEIVYDELLRANGYGGELRFPVSTKEEFAQTVKMLMTYEFTEEKAMEVAGWIHLAHKLTPVDIRQQMFPQNKYPTNVQR